MSRKAVNVKHNGETVARVDYNSNLDKWNGSNFQNGGTGRHLGITRLRKVIDGMTFVLIHGTQWQGEEDTAELVSDETAKQAILDGDNEALLQKWFPHELDEMDNMEGEPDPAQDNSLKTVNIGGKLHFRAKEAALKAGAKLQDWIEDAIVKKLA